MLLSDCDECLNDLLVSDLVGKVMWVMWMMRCEDGKRCVSKGLSGSSGSDLSECVGDECVGVLG